MTLRQRRHTTLILRMSTKDTLGLQEPGSSQLFNDAIATIIIHGGDRQAATNQEEKLLARITLAYDRLSCL